MDIQQLKLRVKALEEAIDKARIEGAAATAQLEKEEDEGVLVTLWARITARKNAGASLEQQLAAARAELVEAEQAAALVHYRQAQAAAAKAYDELKKAAAVTMAKAEAAGVAIDAMVAAQRSTGAKYEHIPGVGRYGADPYGLAADALGLNVLGVWSNFDVRRPQEGIPQSPNPFALGLQNGGR